MGQKVKRDDADSSHELTPPKGVDDGGQKIQQGYFRARGKYRGQGYCSNP